MTKWISIKESDAPPMKTVILCVLGEVIVGWNESVDPDEDPSYCSWQRWPGGISGDGVEYWMPLPAPPDG